MYLKKMRIYAGQKVDKYAYRDLWDILKAFLNSRDEQFVGILKGYQVTLQILPGGVTRGK
jgi:hypothetical protein